MNGYLLDTHAWLWAQQRNTAKASDAYFAQVETWQQQQRAYISDISVLEIARLVAYGRLDLGESVDQFVETATSDGGFQLLPLTTRILIESIRLPGDIHRDPSDRLLAATAREHSFALVTRDDNLLSYGRRGHLRIVEI